MSVLITGGAGSVGKEFVRLLQDQDLTVVDNNEWAVAELHQEFPRVKILLQDFEDVSGEWDYVLHLAAYKHVNLGEENTTSFIHNNLVKTILFYRGIKFKQLLYLSTDKAVEPISVYGMTKSLAESLTLEVHGQIARCGNFLGSSGSVIPVWEKAINENRPLPITDPKMTRYIVGIKDGVRQIWGRFLEGEKLIIPEMGEAKPLMTLANEVLRRHGKDTSYPIEIIGMRPGEKLHEKLRWDHE